jgi:hypothetical protein
MLGIQFAFIRISNSVNSTDRKIHFMTKDTRIRDDLRQATDNGKKGWGNSKLHERWIL